MATLENDFMEISLHEKPGLDPLHPQDSLITLRQSSIVAPISPVNFLDFQKFEFADAISQMKFENLDYLIAKIYAINCEDEQEHQDTISVVYSRIIESLINIKHSESEYFLTVLRELIIFVLNRSVKIDASLMLDIVSYFATKSGEKTLDILENLADEDWSEQIHAIAYSLEWSTEAQEAEKMILDICVELEDPEIEETFELLNNPSVFERKRTILDSNVTPEDQKRLQDCLRQKHWMDIRIRFEYLWRTLIEANTTNSKEEGREFPTDVFALANKLLEAIIHVGKHFEENEYVWYWAERSGISRIFNIQVLLIKLCRKNAHGKEKNLWYARAFALYKQICDKPDCEILGNYDYVKFMQQLTLLIKENEGAECITMYCRVLNDMVSYCGEFYFPITDQIVWPLIQTCHELRNEPKERWEKGFKKIFEIYDLYKYYRSKYNSIFREFEYYDPQIACFLMKLCTENGSINEYKILNRDILLNQGIDLEYADKVRRYQNRSQFPKPKFSEKFDSSVFDSSKEIEIIRSIIVDNL